jgi:hypothetical protein
MSISLMALSLSISALAAVASALLAVVFVLLAAKVVVGINVNDMPAIIINTINFFIFSVFCVNEFPHHKGLLYRSHKCYTTGFKGYIIHTTPTMMNTTNNTEMTRLLKAIFKKMA